MKPRDHNSKPRSQDGFTLLELTIVFVVTALLLLPLLKLALESIGSTREQLTEAALETAAETLIAYAATNKGCLPFAADAEGGLPNLDKDGLPAIDTGLGIADKQGGDLPWSDLGLTESFRDGEHLRLQYYVANPYAGPGCSAGFRGFEYHSNINYVGGNQAGQEVYVYYGEGAGRELYKITGSYSAGEVPPSAIQAPTSAPIENVTDLLPATLLEVRRGPDIDGGGGESDTVSAQNVFVLIAVGSHRNTEHNRTHVRDSNHAGDDGGSSWSIDSSNDLDIVVFSLTTNIDLNDRNNDDDDTLKVMSFLEYKAKLRKFGLNMEPMCEDTC